MVVVALDLSQLPEEVRHFVLENAQVTRHTLQLGYPHLSIGVLALGVCVLTD